MKKRWLAGLLAIIGMPMLSVVPAGAAGGWTAVSKMPNSRFAQAATEGNTGNVYVFGGSPGSGTIAMTMEMYSAATGKWTALPDEYDGACGSGCENEAGATGPEGEIFSIGGGDADADDEWSGFPNLNAYTIKTKSWSAETNMPTARGDLAAVTGPDGLIYALGGLVSDPCTGFPDSTNVVEAYNPKTNAWATEPSMQTPRAYFAAVVSGEILYVFGGSDLPPWIDCEGGGSTTLSSVEAYSFTTHTWKYVAPLPVATDIAGAIVGADGRIYVIGNGTSGPALYIYSVTKNTWTTGEAPPSSGAGPVVGFGSKHGLMVIDDLGGSGKLKSPAYTYPT